MSLCRKCDRCGVIYQDKDRCSVRYKAKELSGIIIAETDEYGEITETALDLCTKCLDSFKSWLFKDSEEHKNFSCDSKKKGGESDYPKKYVKKPVEVEAILYSGKNAINVIMFIGDSDKCSIMLGDANKSTKIKISTLEGDLFANPGDFIIKGIKGECYPCRADIFYETYDEVK